MHKSANQSSSNRSPIPSIPTVKNNSPIGMTREVFQREEKEGRKKQNNKTKKTQLQQKDCPFWQNILIFGTNRIKGGGSKRTTAINPSGRKHRGGRLLRRNYVLHKVDGIMRYQKREKRGMTGAATARLHRVRQPCRPDNAKRKEKAGLY